MNRGMVCGLYDSMTNERVQPQQIEPPEGVRRTMELLYSMKPHQPHTPTRACHQTLLIFTRSISVRGASWQMV